MDSKPSQPKVLWLKMQENLANIPFLIKYAPKYYTKVILNTSKLKRSKILHKIKAIKIARSANIKDYSHDEKGLVLKAFKSQTKCLTSLEGVEKSVTAHFPYVKTFSLVTQDLLSWRVFFQLQHLENISIEFSGPLMIKSQQNSTEKIEKALLWRFSKKLHTQILQNIRLYFCNKMDGFMLEILKRLAAMRNLLSSLQNLTLFLYYIDSFNDYNIVELNTLCEFSTAIKIHELTYSSIQQFLGQLENFKRLKTLTVLKASASDDHENTANFRYLEKLEQLENLESLEISMNFNGKTALPRFLKAISLPHSLTTIKLNFYEVTWESSQQEVFFQNPVYQNFYQKWSKLTKLNSLNLCFYEINESNCPLNLQFITPILQNITNLASFYFASWCESLVKKRKFLDFNFLWQSLSHLKSSLISIYLDAPAISFKNFSAHQDPCASLEKLAISGAIIAQTELPEILRLFPKNLPFCPTKSHFEVDYILVNDPDSLRNLLTGLVHIQRSLQLSLEVDLRKIEAKDLTTIAHELLPKLHKRNFLKLSFTNIPKMEADIFKGLLTEISQYGISECLKIVSPSGRILFLGKDTYINEVEFEDEDSEESVEEGGNEEFYNDPDENDLDFDDALNTQRGYVDIHGVNPYTILQEINGSI